MAEKSEKATPKKLRDARKKGQVAKSQDFPSAITFIVSIATTLALARFLYFQLGGNMVEVFQAIGHSEDFRSQLVGLVAQSLKTILTSSLPIMIATAFMGWLVNFLLVGPMFSTEVLKPDLKRLNPVTNLKNMFKFKTIFELLKSIFKIAGAVVIIYGVIWSNIQKVVATAGLPILMIAEVISDFLTQVVIRVGLFFLVVALADLIYQRLRFAKEMKMEKFELKQEFKDTEGDPHIKSKRRQQAQEMAYQEGPSKTVPSSRAVITNPIHVAVAVDYKEEKHKAPVILAMGKGELADTIIKLAVEHNVPIMRNPALAQQIFQKGELNQYIPEETYEAVAEILKWLAQIEAPEEIHPELFQ